jgi:hypothetical protein
VQDPKWHLQVKAFRGRCLSQAFRICHDGVASGAKVLTFQGISHPAFMVTYTANVSDSWTWFGHQVNYLKK